MAETEQHEELAPVHYLPRQRGDEELAPAEQGEVLDAELVSDEEYRRLFTHKGAALDRYRGYKNDVVRAGRGVRTVATHRHTASAAKFAARHGSYALGGTAHLGRRMGTRAMHGDLTEAIRQARAQGDLGQVAELEKHRREAANDRWRRILIQLKVTGVVSGTIGGGFIATTVATLIYAVVVGIAPGGATFTGVFTEGYWAGVESVVSTLAWAASFWPYALITALSGIAVAAWNTGRKAALTPEWAAPQRTGVAVDEVQVTADRLVTALRHCGIPELKNAIKEGETAGLVDLISQYGPGVRTTITLPRGIPAKKLAEKADSLASSLSRGQHEVTISRSPNDNSQAELWVARPGALDEPVPASPMMDPDYGPVDLYKDPVPWGHSPQGEPIELDLIQRHIMLAGLSKQGKTASARALALHAAFDPSVEFRIADLKGVGDWSMFSGLASVLIEGAGEENELATAEMVERAAAEMDRRIAARRAKGAKGDITAAEAHDGSGDHHPLIVIVDEVQIAYMSSAAEVECDLDGGNESKSKQIVGGQKNNSRLWQVAKKLHDQGRAVNIHLWQFAQNPTDRNLPAIVREGAHVRGSLYVSNPSIARKAIGDAPVDAGAAPDRLRSEIDAGTVVTAGAPEIVKVKGEMANTVRTHFIDTDPAHEVAERAKALRSGPVAAIETESRDLLADVSDVLGEQDKVRATDVCARLRKLASTYRPYRDLGAEGLKAELEQHGVRVTKAGVLMVRADRVRLALSAREEDDEGADEG